MPIHGKKCSFATRPGFTLLEVVVVIGMIALLVGILLPSLSAARGAAKRVACGSNLRQLGVAIHSYAQQNYGLIPVGPKAGPALTAGNFYPATGTPTSLITLLDRRHVGAGLLLEGELAGMPEVYFCPGSDQPEDVADELKKLTRPKAESDEDPEAEKNPQVQSSYFYRHASVDRRYDRPGDPFPTTHAELDRLGKNRDGKPIRVLAIDTQFVVPLTFGSFGVQTRTHHRRKGVNALLYDGAVEWHLNNEERFTVRLDDVEALTNPFSVILSKLEAAD